METIEDLAHLLRALRRREARQRGGAELTYRQLATRAGWSHGVVAAYLTGKILPPTDRFDGLIRLLGAAPAEQGALATARDRVAEHRRASPARTGRAPGALPAPRQLPADVRGFTGRRADLVHLDRLREQGRRSPAAVVFAVTGGVGIGKTALVVHWAHHAAPRFPDGQLYANLCGSGGPGQKPDEVVRAFLEAFHVPPQRLPAGLAAQVGLYRSLLAGKRVLVVLDDACDAEQVRPLLPGAAGCVAVVTSRHELAELVAVEGAHPLRVGPLSAAEARQLLASRLGEARLCTEPAAVNEIIARCGRVPMALTMLAARAALDPELPLATLATQTP